MDIRYSFFQICPEKTEFHTSNYQYWLILSGDGYFSSKNETFLLTSHDILEIPFDKDFQIKCTTTMQIGCIELHDFTSNNTYFQIKNHTDTELVRKTFFYAMDVQGLHLPSGNKLMYLVNQTMFEALVFSGLKDYKINTGIARAIEALNIHTFDTDYDINDAIAQSGYSQSYFHKLFHDTTGVSPLTFIQKKRIDHAKYLLRQGNGLSIKEVAQQCAFSDALYFSKIFKKQTGMSPSAYAKSVAV